MKETFEHYSQFIRENKVYAYYAHSEGYLFKVCKSKRITSGYTNKDNIIPLKGHFKGNRHISKLGKKQVYTSHIIASIFLKDYYPGCCVGYKDNNSSNLNVENLYIYSKKRHGKLSGHLAKSKPVVVIDKNNNKTVYRSGRAAAKSLFVSYQTLFDYINNNVNKSNSVVSLVVNDVYLEK